MPADGGSAYSRRHKDQISQSNADQTEALALRNGGALIDEGIYDELVAGAMDDFENEADEALHEEWHGRDLAEDNGTGEVLEIIEDRQAALGDLYPFEVVNNQVRHRGGALGWYEFMLAASVQKDISSRPFNRMPQLFERASTVLSEGLLGPGAKSLHVGHPRDAEISSFRSGYERLHELTGEWPWKPADDLPITGPPTGDEGLDFVSWMPAGGRMPGHIYLIGQCACGDGWPGKLTDLQLRKINAWTGGGEGWAVDPIRVFATSFVLAEGWFGKEQKSSGLILDRIRLCLLEQARGAEVLELMRAEMTSLSNLALGTE